MGFSLAEAKTHKLKPVLLKPDEGERPGNRSSRSQGMGKFKLDVQAIDLELSNPVRWTGQTEENQQSEYRDTNSRNHRGLGSF